MVRAIYSGFVLALSAWGAGEAALARVARRRWSATDIVLGIPVLVIAAVFVLGRWSSMTDESLVVLVNRTNVPVSGVLTARASSPFVLGPGQRRRIKLRQARASDADFRLLVRLPSGRTISAEGPYHRSSGDFAFDGPDEETIALIGPDRVQTFDVDDLNKDGDVETIGRMGGYEPDRLVPSPDRKMQAVVRTGPSFSGERSWRVIVEAAGSYPLWGARVFEAADAKDVQVRWMSANGVLVRARGAHAVRSQPLALSDLLGPVVQTYVERIP